MQGGFLHTSQISHLLLYPTAMGGLSFSLSLCIMYAVCIMEFVVGKPIIHCPIVDPQCEAHTGSQASSVLCMMHPAYRYSLETNYVQYDWCAFVE